MAVVVFLITGVGLVMALLGLVIPALQPNPSLQPDDERRPGRDVKRSIDNQFCENESIFINFILVIN